MNIGALCGLVLFLAGAGMKLWMLTFYKERAQGVSATPFLTPSPTGKSHMQYLQA